MARSRDEAESPRAGVPENAYRLPEQLAHVLERVSDGVVALDRDWMYTYVNDAAAQFLGRPAEALMGRHIWTEFPEGLGQPFHLAYERAMATGESTVFEAFYQPFSRWFENRIYPSADGITIYFHDITDRKQAEDALQRSENDLAITLASIGDGVIATDASGFVTRVNPAAERLTGWTMADALGRPLRDVFRIVDSRSRVAIVDPVQRVLASGGIVELANHTALLSRTGGEFQIADSAAPIRDAAGAIVGVVLVFSDVSEKYRAQESLRERELRLRTILETEPECVKVIAPDGQLHEMNPAGLELLEVDSLDELRRLGLMRFVVPEYRRLFTTLMRDVLAGNNGVLEFEIIGRKGTRRWLETHAAPLHDPAGGPTLFLGITRDITDRKRADEERATLEKQLRAAERLEAAGLVAGGVAHDFNNLLSVVNIMSELAMDGLDVHDPVRNDLEEIRRAGERATVLTGQLLALSRTQSLTPETIGINALLASLRPMLARVIREDIVLHLGMASSEVYVHADRGQLERVLLNLALNARDAMSNGGTLDIQVSSTTLKSADTGTVPILAAGSYVLLSVTDSGTGMTPETLARIFEPFFTTKAFGRGTGLGLSSSYGIIAQSGGAIAVTSAPGKGSTFRVYLPRIEGSAPVANGGTPLSEAPRGNESILIVDDESALARVAKRVLDDAGYTTYVATSGTEALRIAEAMPGRLHLLFTDVVMPEMRGTELAQRITALHPEIVVLYTSGYYDDDILRDAIQDRSAMLLAKPYAPLELRRKVREILDVKQKQVD